MSDALKIKPTTNTNEFGSIFIASDVSLKLGNKSHVEKPCSFGLGIKRPETKVWGTKVL